MKLSYQWLCDLVDLEGISPEEVAEQLTMRSALIEGLERPGAALASLRVGLVLERKKHPDADRLSICQVDAGAGPIEVVCGAPNVAAGQKIAYAPVGTELPGGLKLEARKIRGVVSRGMICSERELGLGEDHDGILVLGGDAPVGASFVKVMGLDDVIFEIDNKTVTHRPDQWGHLGFARELAGIFGRELKPLALHLGLHPVQGEVSIEVQDREGCPLYLGLRVDKAPAAAASPDWMQRRLRAAGMRPIHLLVDLSNYVMLETGQPTHPFDLDGLAEQRIVVRRALPGEVITTLDEQERKLAPSDLVVADGRAAVAIAGIMGGASCEVGPETRRMLLESAAFDAISVRKTSSRLGLRTDALARFEKFLDPTLPELALRRYAALLAEICPETEIHLGFEQAGQADCTVRRIALRPARARLKLGYNLETAEMAERLRCIGFGVEGDAPDAAVLKVDVPSFRAGRDIEHEDDLIEEVGRMAGYDRVPSVLPRLAVEPPRRDPLRLLERTAALSLVHAAGYTEVLNYSFATDRQVKLYHAGTEPFLKLQNPMAADQSRLRRSLVPGILEHLGRNQLHRDEVRLVEVGRTYFAENGADGLPEERRELAAVRLARSVSGRKKELNYEQVVLDARTDLDHLLVRLGFSWEGGRPEEVPPFAHPGRCLAVKIHGTCVGHLAQLHPKLARDFEIESPTAVLVLRLDTMVSQPVEIVKMRPIPAFPAARRDLSMEAPESLLIGAIEAEILAAGKKRITRVELFDVYRGPGIAEGHRSLAFRLSYRAEDRTLTDEEVEGIHQRVMRRLEGLGARPRV